MPDSGRFRPRRPMALLLLLVPTVAVVALVATSSRAGPTASPSEQESGPTPAGPVSYIVGTATAGPVCPTQELPPSPCAPRPVSGAVIIVSNVDQGEVARAATAADGSYQILLHGWGTYTVTAQPVQGLIGTPPPVTVNLNPMDTKRVDFEYSTGITDGRSSIGCACQTPTNQAAALW